MCLDGGGQQMTYEEIKDAARWVEQREDPSMSDDPFVQDNAVPTPRDDGHQDQDGQPQCNQGHPQYRSYTCPMNHSQLAVRAVNVEDHRAEDYHNETDNCDLEEGEEDMGFDPNDYEGVEQLPSLPSTTTLLPPYVKAVQITYHYEQQEQQCYTCNKTVLFMQLPSLTAGLKG